jgi:peptidase E
MDYSQPVEFSNTDKENHENNSEKAIYIPFAGVEQVHKELEKKEYKAESTDITRVIYIPFRELEREKQKQIKIIKIPFDSLKTMQTS